MEIKTRNEALICGDVHYFTGVPCNHGHVTFRYASTGGCNQCVNGDRGKFTAPTYRERELAKIAKDREAMEKSFEIRLARADSKDRAKLGALTASNEIYQKLVVESEALAERKRERAPRLREFLGQMTFPVKGRRKKQLLVMARDLALTGIHAIYPDLEPDEMLAADGVDCCEILVFDDHREELVKLWQSI